MKISMYITSYNQKGYLVRAIESVLSQTLRPSQIIVIDDCSSDGSQEIISGYASKYPELIETIYHSQNFGIARTRTNALKSASGDYITYVDGDDILLPNKLEKELAVLTKNPGSKIAFSNYYYIDPEGYRLGLWANNESPPQGNVFCQTISRNFPKDTLFRNELVHHSCFKEIGYYDHDLKIYEDWDLKIRLTKKFKVLYTFSPLSEYRQNPDGLSQSDSSLHLSSIEAILRKNGCLLNDLDVRERKDARRKINCLLSKVAKKSAKQSYTSQHFLRTIKYFSTYLRYSVPPVNM